MLIYGFAQLPPSSLLDGWIPAAFQGSGASPRLALLEAAGQTQGQLSIRLAPDRGLAGLLQPEVGFSEVHFIAEAPTLLNPWDAGLPGAALPLSGSGSIPLQHCMAQEGNLWWA
ncbi:hypothetical protein DSO57_1028558 [Entomophthora muscae]|uniref:Uncharacterized protein n=1 Tax=Entomophthora muscae TaxID=34485 RepID=A0ACC2UB04_9FUNG|nr:hypothetical protein DSO57_1028558 [Entomophthora muscae]